MEQILKDVWNFLKEAKLYVEGVGQYNGLPVVEVCIMRGDWKHEHNRCDLIMKEHGFSKVSEIEIGHSQEDVYSSNHYYLKTA